MLILREDRRRELNDVPRLAAWFIMSLRTITSARNMNKELIRTVSKINQVITLAFHIYHRGLSLVAAAGLNEGVIGRRGRRLGRLAGDGAVRRAGRAAAHAGGLDADLAARGAGVGRPNKFDNHE